MNTKYNSTNTFCSGLLQFRSVVAIELKFVVRVRGCRLCASEKGAWTKLYDHSYVSVKNPCIITVSAKSDIRKPFPLKLFFQTAIVRMKAVVVL